MNVGCGMWNWTHLFKFRGEYPNLLGSSAPLLCPLFFGGEGGHDTKRREHNFTKNNCYSFYKFNCIGNRHKSHFKLIYVIRKIYFIILFLYNS